ncbi:SIMPL domain-containing protein [Sandaracinus amylolyticus]|uniref:SIMPL domain-containing protein n=1 Tax=Sandaracinus amylolyticus TaxID=927083 RepID=UPI00146FEDC9|nr:SIMPL domain-containing protein [Sandaracinus amylolyticus]
MDRALIVLLVVVSFACVACGGSLRSGETLVLRESEHGILVSEEGEAEARPDRARFHVGVEARRPTVAEARDAAADAQRRVLDALRANGIGDEDVQTDQLSVNPEYEYTDQGQRLLGYTVRNAVHVRVTDVSRLSATIDAAVGAGGDLTRLDGIQFEVSDPSEVRARAREQAMQRARATAEQLARLAGVELGEPIAIEEVVQHDGPRPLMMEARMAADTAQATPIEPGVTRTTVQLRVRWSTH